jgi:hypothetical protein
MGLDVTGQSNHARIHPDPLLAIVRDHVDLDLCRLVFSTSANAHIEREDFEN